MQQLALPYRIALIAVLAAGAVWFAVLRPKPASDDGSKPLPAAPGVTGLANDVKKAQGAVSTANAAAATEQATGNTGGTSAPAATASTPAPATTPAAPAAPAAVAPKPKPKPAAPVDPSQGILADVAAKKVAVVLFYNPLGADDNAVRRALKGLDRFGGRVTVRSAPIGRVGDYSAITAGVQVLQAPTLLVIGHDKVARRIVGLTDTKEIQQLVGDVGGAGFSARRTGGS